jgi:hypothetical protein
MSVNFHRLTPVPYFVSETATEYTLPTGYDFINNPAQDGYTSGEPAAADGMKLYGPNQGSYFVTFGEDAIGVYVNRPAAALSTNTDYLDNLMHQDVAQPVAYEATGNGTTQLLLPAPITGEGGVFLGGTSTALEDLFHLCDTQDEDLILISASTTPGIGVQIPVVVESAVDQGTPSPASPYFSGGAVLLTFNVAIPSGMAFRIYYAQRSNLASLPPDALTRTNIRTLTDVSYQVEELFSYLQAPEILSVPWAGPNSLDTSPKRGFFSTIWDLSISGLNDRYNRSTSSSSSPPTITPPEAYWPTLGGSYGSDYGPLDVAGSGGWISRTGPALTVYSGNVRSDPICALFSAKNWDTQDTGGIVDYVAYGTRLSGVSGESSTGRVPGAALFMGLWPHDLTTEASVLTRIQAGAAAIAVVVSTVATVTVTQPDNYFRSGGLTVVAPGYDLLELTSPNGEMDTLVIVGITGPESVEVRRLDGSVPVINGWSGTIRWVSTSFAVGDGAGAYHAAQSSESVFVKLDGLFYQVPPKLTGSAGSDSVSRTPRLLCVRQHSC